MKLQDKLQHLKKARKAILAVNFYNYETLAGSLEAAAKLKTSIILQLTESSIKYMGLKIACRMAKAALEEFGVEGWLHLDHSNSVELIKQCLDTGFDSVMIDASEKPLDENIKITCKVMEIAAFYGANVEAELGYIPKSGQPQERKGFTDPFDAAEFIKSTGVNSLAVAIGSAHGFYSNNPDLNIKLLSEINRAVNVPLVLHGSSGIPDQMLIDAIRNGICKINVATEIKHVFMRELKNILKSNENIDLRLVFPPVIQAINDQVMKKLTTLLNA